MNSSSLFAEVPIQAVFASSVSSVIDQAKLDIAQNLAVLEDHMTTKTFMVGENVSLADISLFSVYLVAVQLKLFDIATFPSLFRWFMTVGSHADIRAVLGDLNSAIGGDDLVKGQQPIRSTPAGKWDRHRVRVKELLKEGSSAVGKEVTLKGWVRTARTAEKGLCLFVELTDGSTVKGIQLVMNTTTTEGMQNVVDSGGVGASLSVQGMVVASPAKGQVIEVHVATALVLGAVYGGDKGEIGGKNYPMAKKQHSLEFLREKAHLRPRSKVFSSAMRMRHAMAFATHKFFNERGFVYVHTPIITAADCEGAGEQFVITTLLPEEVKHSAIAADKQGHVDYSKDFFGRRCCLTVSGQLNVETHACALSDVYTFGPTFRAENSHTARHLAEFWMIEPEICFADLADDMSLAVRFLHHVSRDGFDDSCCYAGGLCPILCRVRVGALRRRPVLLRARVPCWGEGAEGATAERGGQ